MKAKAVQTRPRQAAMRPVRRSGKSRRPPLLQIPSEALKPVEMVLAACTDDGRRRFLDELHRALESADPIGELWFTVEAWYRTLAVISDPDFEEATVAATKPGGAELLTLEEFRRLLGV